MPGTVLGAKDTAVKKQIYIIWYSGSIKCHERKTRWVRVMEGAGVVVGETADEIENENRC